MRGRRDRCISGKVGHSLGFRCRVVHASAARRELVDVVRLVPWNAEQGPSCWDWGASRTFVSRSTLLRETLGAGVPGGDY
jgi:hypothetical protein